MTEARQHYDSQLIQSGDDDYLTNKTRRKLTTGIEMVKEHRV